MELPSIYDLPPISNEEEDEDEDIVITNVINNDEEPLRKRRQLLLLTEERKNIKEGEMLTDESINSAQNLLHNQFPLIEGFYDTVLGSTNGFEIINPFIQIL